MAKTENVQPWERQPGETTKQFEAFQAYRDMDEERSIRAVAKSLDKSRNLIGRWSAANNWVERAAAWDVEKDRLLRIQQQQDIKKMRKRHADLATSMLMKAASALKKLPVDEIKASDLTRMVQPIDTNFAERCI